MKFTNGYWLMRENIEPLFAVEYADHRIRGDELTVYAATRNVRDRGDCLNSGLLTVRFTTPMENVIHVSITHFDGARYDGPFVPVNTQPVSPLIRQEEGKLIYQSGTLRAEISRNPSAWDTKVSDCFSSSRSFCSLVIPCSSSSISSYRSWQSLTVSRSSR